MGDRLADAPTRMRVHRVRRVGNSNLVALPRFLEADGFVAGAEVVIRMEPDGSVSIVPVTRIRVELIGARAETAMAADPGGTGEPLPHPASTPATEVIRERLRQLRLPIKQAAFRVDAAELRVVGPVALGTATVDSPVDFLVRFRPRVDGGRPTQAQRRETLRDALQSLIWDRPITVVSETSLRGRAREMLRQQARGI